MSQWSSDDVSQEPRRIGIFQVRERLQGSQACSLTVQCDRHSTRVDFSPTSLAPKGKVSCVKITGLSLSHHPPYPRHFQPHTAPTSAHPSAHCDTARWPAAAPPTLCTLPGDLTHYSATKPLSTRLITCSFCATQQPSRACASALRPSNPLSTTGNAKQQRNRPQPPRQPKCRRGTGA